MIDRTTKLRWRRRLRRSRRQVEDLGVQAEEQLEQHFIRRLSRLASVRRFIFGWTLLLLFLISGVVYQIMNLSHHYQTLEPVAGGIYSEGILGTFTNANPLYANSAVDSAVSRLLFAGLLKYDQNGKLVGDLAEKWSADETGTLYTVVLKPDLRWHDGHALTAADVLFTYQTIQNPDAKSSLFTSWQGIKVQAVNARTLTFAVPSVLASFPYSLTNGIVPKHLLAQVPVAQLRSIQFDTVSPVGSGPFRWEAIQVDGETPDTRRQQIALAPNKYYYNGAPKLQQFKIRTFMDEKSMVTSFQHKEIIAMSGLDATPDTFAKDANIREHNIPIMGQVGVFFRVPQEVLQDVKVRQALVQAVDQNGLLNSFGYPVIATHEPFLNFQLGYAKDLQQLPYNQAQAAKLLDQAGWVKGNDGIRTKGGKPLTFQLYSQSTSEYAHLTQQLQVAWRAIGVQAQVLLQPDTDIQDTVSKHAYDALLYGISLGPDPDVFAYWHSSQASTLSATRFNFSEYKSSVADKALEAGRTRTDPALRAVKYRPFLEAWRNDAPALLLYQPRYLYVTNGDVNGFRPRMINSNIDRYANVEQWMIKLGRVNN
jgi:peptide/nickel transport system substrate-binding protein